MDGRGMRDPVGRGGIALMLVDGRDRRREIERTREIGEGREGRNEGIKRKLGKDVQEVQKRKGEGEEDYEGEDVLDGRKGSGIQEIRRKGGERCG